jgi:hypothetical protein
MNPMDSHEVRGGSFNTRDPERLVALQWRRPQETGSTILGFRGFRCVRQVPLSLNPERQ